MTFALLSMVILSYCIYYLLLIAHHLSPSIYCWQQIISPIYDISRSVIANFFIYSLLLTAKNNQFGITNIIDSKCHLLYEVLHLLSTADSKPLKLLSTADTKLNLPLVIVFFIGISLQPLVTADCRPHFLWFTFM